MKVLNLVDPEKSEIKYKISKFPDGQQNITILDPKPLIMASYSLLTSSANSVEIKSRLNNWLDLELITCAVASLREIDRDIEIHLYTPYIMGARSDRKFEEGGNNYLKDVICPAINALGCKTVTCIDPHSDVLEACIKGFRKEANKTLLENALFNIQTGIYPGMLNKPEYLDKFILVSPDAGASKKIYKLAEYIGYKGDIITCSKDRDTDGKLTKTVVPLTMNMANKDYIIIDDICDGGATFINIAKEIKSKPLKGNIYLIVTHGIFSKGFHELAEYFDGIYCTNSYARIKSPMELGTMSGVHSVLEKGIINRPDIAFVKQLNVF